jgi:small subunit ribosomal protein S21
MPHIRVKKHEPIEIAIRKFKRSCESAGVLEDCRKKEFFEKPTWEKKRKKKAAIQREHQQQRRNKIKSKRLY